MADDIHPARFMLLGSARTGSNFLSSLLSAHPAIKMYGELFNLDTLPKADLLDALEDPVEYLRKRLYRSHRPEIAATGFKIFYDHLTKDYFSKLIDPSQAAERLRRKFSEFASFVETSYDWPTLEARFQRTWEFLAADRSLAVLHLKRRNMLNTLVSYKTAFITTQWWSLKERHQEPTTLSLDPDECRRYFSKLEGWTTAADAAFTAHRTLDVFYEDLVAQEQRALDAIFTFIGVPPHAVSTIMKKQIQAPVSEIVLNYGQLKESFKGTKWHVFFED